MLEDISLSFEAGQLYGIMGPNGAGKTTCFNVLTGRYGPTAAASGSTAGTSPACRRSPSRGWASRARSRS